MEKIVCAAIWYTNFPKAKAQLPTNLNSGVVVSGLNHAQIIYIVLSLTGKKQYECKWEQGFITTENRFVDRIEGLEIARRENQIIHKHGSSQMLFSEDLYVAE